MRKLINFVENIFQRLRNASEEKSRMVHQLGGKGGGQHVRLMGQTSAKWERERQGKRVKEIVSSLVVVLQSFFIISTLGEATRQPGKPNITKHTTSACLCRGGSKEGGRGSPLDHGQCQKST